MVLDHIKFEFNEIKESLSDGIKKLDIIYAKRHGEDTSKLPKPYERFKKLSITELDEKIEKTNKSIRILGSIAAIFIAVIGALLVAAAFTKGASLSIIPYVMIAHLPLSLIGLLILNRARALDDEKKRREMEMFGIDTSVLMRKAAVAEAL